MKLPNLHETFVLQRDASDRGLGAVLFQFEQNEKLPIANASRKDCECARKRVFGHCMGYLQIQKYLYDQEFALEIDHSPLVYLSKFKVAHPRLMRLALSLQPYRFRIQAIKSKDNVGTDYLSRL